MRQFTVLALLTLVACGASESDARQYLKSQGIEVTEIEKDGDSFAFTGKKENQVCTGTVTITGGNSKFSTICRRDVSACKPGASTECMAIAGELYDMDPKDFPHQAAELYRIACFDGNAVACARAGEFEAIEKRWDKVREYSKNGCELGNGAACVRLGFTELNGNGTTKDETKAVALFKMGCAKSVLKGCRAAAGILIDKEPPDLDGSIAAAEPACKANHEDSCVVLGFALFSAKRDYPRALGLLEPICNDTKFPKRGLACNVAGAIVHDGLGMKQDGARGMALLEKSCEAEFAQGCLNVGKFYENGAGVPKNAAKSKQAYAKACKLGEKQACGK